jgi:hypothetical protein
MRMFVCTLGLMLATGLIRAQSFHPDIPKVWDDREMARLELPLAHAEDISKACACRVLLPDTGPNHLQVLSSRRPGSGLQ